MSKRKSDQYLEIDDETLQEQVENLLVSHRELRCCAIRTFIDNGEMEVGEFQKAIGASSVSYSRFMSQSGPSKGMGSNVYIDAYQFFKKRELRGIKMPKKRAKTTATGASDAVPDVSSVTLDGEMTNDVEIYDTCDEIRRKINAHLQKPGVTQAQFLRDISAQHRTNVKKIQSKQLNDFRSKKGPTAGNTSSVFYGAYVYFEKLRIKESKPKTKTRLETEKTWIRQGGIRTDRRLDRVFAHFSDTVTQDKYGQIKVSRGAPNPFRDRY